MKRLRPKAIDLFSGCGGLSVGLELAGFDVVAAVEADPLAAATYRDNHPKALVEQKDIKKTSPKSMLARLGIAVGGLDLLAGCPPCQGFSSLRTLNGARTIEEPMNDLVFEFLRFVRAMRPRAIMLENVPGLLNDDRLTGFKKALHKLGYISNADVFNAINYGVPQRRRRMILMAIRGKQPAFGSEVEERVSVRDAIGGLPEPSKSTDPSHNYSEKRAPHILELIRNIPKDGGSRSSLAYESQLPCHQKTDGFKDVYGRMAWEKASPTITGGCTNPSKGRFLHPSQDRAITLREAALLQGFPADYKFDMSKSRQANAQMIGNAFPPAFAARHAKALRLQLQEN